MGGGELTVDYWTSSKKQKQHNLALQPQQSVEDYRNRRPFSSRSGKSMPKGDTRKLTESKK